MAADHMPLDGWDHVELWVGNAKQAAYWYEHALGFARVAYAGPETGVRDRASYVLEQAEIRFVLTSPLREASEISQHVARHGDGVKDIALAVPDATEAYRQAMQRGARGVVEPHWVSDANGPAEGGVGLQAIDHCVGNVELGRMNHWVEFYEQVFGMTEMIHFSDEDISTEYSALMS